MKKETGLRWAWEFLCFLLAITLSRFFFTYSFIKDLNLDIDTLLLLVFVSFVTFLSFARKTFTFEAFCNWFKFTDKD